MNKLLLSLFAMFFFQYQLSAQVTDRRTTTTKIADLLALQPAQTPGKLQDAITQLDRFSDKEITGILLTLNTDDIYNNAKVEYALNSYSYTVLQGSEDKEIRRTKFIRGCKEALNDLNNDKNKSFVITLLQNAGNDDAVPVLANFLQDDYLGEKAAAALASINSPAAGEALLVKLPYTRGKSKLAIIQALGFIGYKNAEQKIIELAGSASHELSKTILFALANIAGNDAEPVLTKAANDGGYIYEPRNATAACLLYAGNLLKQGKKETASRVAELLFKNTNTEGSLATHIAALQLLTAINGQAQIEALAEAALNRNSKYRNAALLFLKPYINERNTSLLLKSWTLNDEYTQADLLRFLGENKVVASLPQVSASLDSPSETVRISAIKAYGQLEGERGIPTLLNLLSSGGHSIDSAVQQQLLTVKGNSLIGLLVTALPKAPVSSKVILMQVLASKGATQSATIITGLLSDKNPKVADAAYKALPMVVDYKSLSQLLDILPATSEIYAPYVQQAIIAAVNSSGNKTEGVGTVVQRLKGVPAAMVSHYFHILAGIGTKKAEEAIKPYLRSGNPQKQAALMALASWNDGEVLPELLIQSRIEREPEQVDAILKGIVRLNKLDNQSAEKKVLVLRAAYQAAVTPDQKKILIAALASHKTFNALVFAGEFLYDTLLQQVAAETVMNIALDNKNFYGGTVLKLLGRVLEVLNDTESPYEREAVRKHLVSLPKGAGFIPLPDNQGSRSSLRQYKNYELLIDSRAGNKEWNTFKVLKQDDGITMYLNGEKVADQVALQKYWASLLPVLQKNATGTQAVVKDNNYRDAFIREIPHKRIFTLSAKEKEDGFKMLFDGTSLDQWTGNTTSYTISDEGTLAIYPQNGSGGDLFTKEQFSDFVYRFEFRLTHGANNGIGIRAPLEGDAAYVGMEIQVLDNDADVYKSLMPYQYHGSVYGVISAKRGYLKPVGEWNREEIWIKGNRIKVTLNDTVIVEGDISEASKSGTLDGKDHPGLKRKSGHIAFLGHGSEVHFRNIRVKEVGGGK